MKKVLALTLALVMMLSFAACGGSGSSGSSAKDAPNPAVQAYFDSQGDTLLTALETSFASSSGMECESSLEIIGDGFVIEILIQDLDDVPDESKEMMQQAYDSMGSTFDAMLEAIQTECPECEYMTIKVCEEDGDLLATIEAK